MASRPAAQAPSASSAATATIPTPHSPSKYEPAPTSGSQDAKASPSGSMTSTASPGPWRPSFARQQSNSALSSPSASTSTGSNNGPARPNSLLRHHSARNSSSSTSSGAGSGGAAGAGSSGHYHPMESPSLSAALSKDTGYFSHPGSSSPRLSSPSIYNKPSSPGPGSGIGGGAGGSGGSFSSSMPTSQPLNLEALAAKFADPKGTEKYANLQLSPALSPGGFLDKDRRGVNSSSSSAGSSGLGPSKSHHHHPRSTPSGHSSPSIPSSSSFGQSSPMHSPLLRQQSLGHAGTSALSSSSSTSPQKPTTSSPSSLATTVTTSSTATGAATANTATSSSLATLNGSSGLKSPLSQSTDMRRTASHNSAFATGLGAPISSHQSNGTSPLSSGLAPFSLGSIAPTPRRSSLHPDDPAAPAASAAKYKDQHPLQHSWTLYYDVSTGYGRQGSSLHHFESGLKELGTFQSVESFARYFNWIQKPHKMDNSTNYHLFKDGIKPMWEDPANAKGGRWIVTLLNKNPELLDKYWLELAYSLVGEQLDEDDDICGAGKPTEKFIYLLLPSWLTKRLVKLLDLSKERMSMEFQITGDVATTPIATPKRYITLDMIRKDLEAEQQESAAKLRRASSDADATTNGLQSVSASPTEGASGNDSNNTRTNNYDGTAPTVASSSGGLLISMESAPTKNTPIVSVTRTEIEA
ncbi:hypothetical protein BGZ73_002090 [Actinomortierella ambigua]|nr:hypothetical protein BGZ73_002090 [Actinomortierella ambigua]